MKKLLSRTYSGIIASIPFLMALLGAGFILSGLTGCATRFNNPQTQAQAASSVESDTVDSPPFPPRLLFGKTDFTAAPNTIKGFNIPSGVFSDGKRLFVADTGKHRILIYNSIPSENYAAADVVLGQRNLKSSPTGNYKGVSPSSLLTPSGVYSDGNRLYVSDTGNNRVLIWNTIPTSDFAPADVVLGQKDFYTNFANRGASTPARNSLSGPVAVLTVGSKLFIVDKTNSRVLVWNDKNSITNGANADDIIGKTTYTLATANYPSRTASSLATPSGIASDGTKLLITDTGNNRVLIWNSIPTAGVAADSILGQTLATTNTANLGGISDSSLSSPMGIIVNSGKIYLTESGNNRILIWNSIPVNTNKVSANMILGQDSFTAASGCNKGGVISLSDSVCAPYGISIDGTRLYLADNSNNRILIWKNIPNASNRPADLVLGQPELSNQAKADNSPTTATSFQESKHALVVGGRLITSHGAENRVLIWNKIPTESGVAPDLVLGQPDFTSNLANNDSGMISARTLKNPRSICSDGTRLVVSDMGNSRILIWNSIPTRSYTPADIVIGQAGFSSNSVNQGSTPSARSLSSASQVVCDGTYFVVADGGNNRVLIWNSFPKESNTPADVVLGQPNKTSNTSNNGGISAKSLAAVKYVAMDSGKILVNDYINTRILIWNSIPTTDFTPADVVLGQKDFTSALSRVGTGNNLRYLGLFEGFTAKNGRIYAHADNGKILVWNSIPTVSFTPADWIYGALQPFDYDVSEYIYSSISQITVTDQYLFFGDNVYYRVLGLPLYPMGFYTHNETFQTSGKLTVNDCTNLSGILVNEGNIPSANDPTWQNCSTQPGAIQFTFKDTTEGVHVLKGWRKNTDGKVLSEPVPLPLAFDITPPLPPPARISSANPSAAAAITVATGTCSDVPRVLITEDSTPPKTDSPDWTTCAASMSYTLKSQTGSSHTIYVWGKDRAENVSVTPNTFNVTY